jgi:hypothetical protein
MWKGSMVLSYWQFAGHDRDDPGTAMLSPALVSPRSPRHGFLASATERHADGRGMASMRHQRPFCACC